jgi:uncharacterized membrane protein YdjX (TVP38/TMEM64 family)
MTRAAVAGALTVLMGGGYFASQAAFFKQTTKAYTDAVDGSAIPWISLLLLAAVVVLAFIPDREEDRA